MRTSSVARSSAGIPPTRARCGFVKSAGLKSIKDAAVVKDEKKGDFYVVRIDKPGRPAREIIAE